MEKLAQTLDEIMRDSMNGTEDGALVVEGVTAKFGFSPAKIEKHKATIKEALDAMPTEFHASGGGGWSFLNLCMTKDGKQWGEHRDVQNLIVLGIAAGMAKYQLPRELWAALPGGMPYIVFNTAAK